MKKDSLNPHMQHVLEPSKKRGYDEPSTLDLILTGEEAQISDLNYHRPLGKGDHTVLSFYFDCYVSHGQSSDKFIFNKADFEAIR